MGSSTKKHKSEKTREGRKRKHRSRSKSPEPNNERHRHRRHHRRRSEKDRADKNEHFSSEDEVPTSVPPPPKLSRESETPPPAPSISSGSNAETLSIQESNKLRAKLGLKPLKVEDSEVTTGPKKTAAELMGGKDMGEFVHRAPENLGAKTKAEKLRQKLKDRRDKRQIDDKLKKVKGLGDDSSDDDAAVWVSKTRKIQDEKEQAAKRAKMLQEMDDEFGVGELVHDEFHHAKSRAYTARDLRGLKVQHDVDNFTEDRQVILTLQDKDVLDEEDDVLVNVNLVDDEKYKKNIERKKQNKTGYSAYDDEKVDEFGNVEKSLLGKYDEEIDGEKRKAFVIGGESSELERREFERKMIQAKLKKKTLETLAMPGLTLASEYYTEEEMVKFKKPKKKIRKIRKKVLKASDLEATAPSSSADLGKRKRSEPEKAGGFKPVDESNDQPSTSKEEEPEDMDLDSDSEERRRGILDIDDMPPIPEDLSDIRLEPDEGELELQLALTKARKLKQIKDLKPTKRIENIATRVLQIKQELDNEEAGTSGHIMLNATAEFCRTLGDIPTYGMAGNRDEDVDDLMDYDQSETKRTAEEEKEIRGTWNEVEVDDTPVDILPPEAPILEEEPDVGSGVAGALRLAVSKGYLEKETSNKPSNTRMNHLQAQNYSIDDKNYIEDDKHSRRERFNGPTSDFREKDGYKPNINLEYIDDDGKILNAKEAFRYLSHKFHGKGPGKNKVEKRIKKQEQEALMKQMNSTDTPLGTVTMLQQKQKETHCPYVVLSGSKQLTSISKTKM